MPLKAIVENLDDLEDELVRNLYKEVKVKGADGKEKPVFALDIEGADAHPSVAALKNAHERQKAETAKAKARVAELEAKHVDVPEGFTPEEWTRLLAVDEEYKKNANDPDKKKIHEAEIQSVKAMYTQQIENLRKKSEADLKAERDSHMATKSSLRGRVVGDDLGRALVEAGVDKKFLAAAKALLERSVKVHEENGTMTAMFETDLGEQPIDQFIPQWAQSDAGKHFLVPAHGGGAAGSDGNRNNAGQFTNNPWAKSSWNMTQQAQVFSKDPGKADRWAKAAGHPQALGAKQADAK